jgi:hypothetical protein
MLKLRLSLITAALSAHVKEIEGEMKKPAGRGHVRRAW